MIKEYISDLASQTGITLYKIVVKDGSSLGCLDAHLVILCAKNKLVSEIIHQSDIDAHNSGTGGEILEIKVRGALEKLRMLTASIT